MIPLGHAGHWLTAIAAAVPPLAVLVWLAVVAVRDRRKVRRGQ